MTKSVLLLTVEIYFGVRLLTAHQRDHLQWTLMTGVIGWTTIEHAAMS